MKRTSTILVTGASGFIGSALLERLIDSEQFNPVAAVRHGSSLHTAVAGRCDQVTVDELGAETDWSRALDNVDIVVHLAARAHDVNQVSTLDDFRETNVTGSEALVRQAAAAGARRVVFLSSIGVVGNRNSEAFTEFSACRPQSAYAQSKHEAEIALSRIAAESELELVILRPPLVYGARAPANFRRLVRLVKKLPALPFGVTHNRRSLVNVENLVDFIETCCLHPNAAGETFLIADDGDVSIRDITDSIAAGLGKKIWQLPIPPVLMRLAARILGRSPMASQLLDDLIVDNSKARQLLGWSARFGTRDSLAACDYSQMMD